MGGKLVSKIWVVKKGKKRIKRVKLESLEFDKKC